MKYRTIASIIVFFVSLSAWAETGTVLIIDQGVKKGRPIAVVPFGWQGTQAQPPQDMAKIIGDDLLRSGMFEPIERAKFQSSPIPGGEINYADWRIIKAENLIIGKVTESTPDSYNIEVILHDIYRQKELKNISAKANKNTLRKQAHKIADLMFKELTGDAGAFATQLAYIQQTPGKKEYFLYISDSDGYNRQEVLKSPTPLISPSWSPDGEHIAYARQSGGRWEIVVQNLYTTERRVLSDIHPALKSSASTTAPAYSPDGKRLAFAMSKNDNMDIYVAGLEDGYFKRVTDHFEVDTEPSWMPDGKTLVFTSGRGGNPQLYIQAVEGGTPKRLTFEGSYNARSSVSPDGRTIAFVHGRQNTYHIGVLDVERGSFSILTETSRALYESPTFAPNGQMIAYTASREGERFTPLKVLSVDGRTNFTIKPTANDDIREPAWSHFLSN